MAVVPKQKKKTSPGWFPYCHEEQCLSLTPKEHYLLLLEDDKKKYIQLRPSPASRLVVFLIGGANTCQKKVEFANWVINGCVDNKKDEKSKDLLLVNDPQVLAAEILKQNSTSLYYPYKWSMTDSKQNHNLDLILGSLNTDCKDEIPSTIPIFIDVDFSEKPQLEVGDDTFIKGPCMPACFIYRKFMMPKNDDIEHLTRMGSIAYVFSSQ